jgi:hypothetical protein
MRLQQLLGKFWIRVENLNAGPGINHILLLIKTRLESNHFTKDPVFLGQRPLQGSFT